MMFKRLKKIADISSNKQKMIEFLEEHDWIKESENEYANDMDDVKIDLHDYEIEFISGSPINDTDGPDSENAGFEDEYVCLSNVTLKLNEDSVEISFTYENNYYIKDKYVITYEEAFNLVKDYIITNSAMWEDIGNEFFDNYNWPVDDD